MQEEMGIFGLQMQTIIKCQVGSLEVKNAVSEMNSFNDFISWLNTEEGKISKLLRYIDRNHADWNKRGKK